MDLAAHPPSSISENEYWHGVKIIHPSIPVQDSSLAARYLMEQVYYPFNSFLQEEFVVLILDSKHAIRYQIILYRGTINTVVVRISEVFREAVRFNAFALLIAHNHPSGQAIPSEEDIALTKNIYQAGELLDIALLDHIIIGNNQWVSLKHMGYIV